MGVTPFVRPAEGSRAAGTGRRRWPGVLLAVLVVATTVVVAFESPSSGRAFDPTSRGPEGLAVLVDVLVELGVEVDVVDELTGAGGADAVLAPPLGWDPAELADVAAAGARVVAVLPPLPDAVLVDQVVAGIGPVTREVDCDLLADVGALRSPTWRSWEVPAAAAGELERCLVDDLAAWATVVEVGDGTVVALGTFAPLVNDRMRDEDAAVAAVRLLDVRPGDRVVALTVPGVEGGPTLFDLVDDRWFDAAWLTLLVLVLAAAARGRRLGRPVAEDLPVRVPSGELARATGDLRHRTGAHAAALEELRQRTLALVGARLGVGTSPTGEEALSALHGAGLAPSEAAEAVLRRPPPADLDAAGLTRGAAALASIRASVRRGATAGAPERDDGPPGPGPEQTPETP